MIQRYQPYPFFWFVQPYSTLKQKRVPNHDVGGKKKTTLRGRLNLGSSTSMKGNAIFLIWWADLAADNLPSTDNNIWSAQIWNHALQWKHKIKGYDYTQFLLHLKKLLKKKFFSDMPPPVWLSYPSESPLVWLARLNFHFIDGFCINERRYRHSMAITTCYLI